MAFSRFGRKLAAAHFAMILFALIVLAFSVRVNNFTDWFFHADLFPFGLSIATILVIGTLMVLDCVVNNPFTGRAQFEFVVLGFLSLFWLAFNAFTTSRYTEVPYQCFSVIPDDEPGLRSWCINVQVVKGFMWIEWVCVVVTLVSVARFAQREYSKGNRHVLKVALSRYDPHSDTTNNPSTAYPFAPGQGHAISNPRPITGMSDSEFMVYEKALGHETNYYTTQRFEVPSRLESDNDTYLNSSAASYDINVETSTIPEEPIPEHNPYVDGNGARHDSYTYSHHQQQPPTSAGTLPSAGTGHPQSYDSDSYRLNSYYADASGYTPNYQNAPAMPTTQYYQQQYP